MKSYPPGFKAVDCCARCAHGSFLTLWESTKLHCGFHKMALELADVCSICPYFAPREEPAPTDQVTTSNR